MSCLFLIEITVRFPHSFINEKLIKSQKVFYCVFFQYWNLEMDWLATLMSQVTLSQTGMKKYIQAMLHSFQASEWLHPCCSERKPWDLRPWMLKPPSRSQDWRVTFELPLLVFVTVLRYIMQLFQRGIDINICTNKIDICINIILVWEAVWIVFWPRTF